MLELKISIPSEHCCNCEFCENKHETKTFRLDHSYNFLAIEAGLYDCIWRAGCHGFIIARNIIPELEAGIKKIKEEGLYFREFSPKNCDYKKLLEFAEDVLKISIENPKSLIQVIH